MNSNMTLACAICHQDTDCRIGYSNRQIQPLSFSCPHCGSLMQITLDISRAPASDFQFRGCGRSKNQPRGPFNGTNPFVDLHLDFPVRFGKYQMGNTPFMMATAEIQATANGDAELAMAMMQFHSERLNQLNHFHDRADEVRSIIRLYKGKNKQLFKKRVSQFLGADEGPSLEPQDINTSLYSFISFVFLPFVNFEGIEELVEGFTNLTVGLHSRQFSTFVGELVSSGFLSNLQSDCLKLYPEIYDAEMPLRAALYLDLIKKEEGTKTAARISTKDFMSYKDLYKDIVEVLGRQLILVAGINNVIHRKDHNKFKVINGGALSSLEKFAAKTLSEKFKCLDDCWYAIDKSVVDAGVRNSIAHNNVQYDEISQVVTYFPIGGGIAQHAGETMHFLDFMRLILVLFREMNDLHHLIKCLFYYEYLARHTIPIPADGAA